MKKLLFLIPLLLSLSAFAGVRRQKIYNESGTDYIEKVFVEWWAANGSGSSVIPVGLYGTILKIESVPGMSAYGLGAPTDNYDFVLNDVDANTNAPYDVINGAGANRDYQTTEVAFPLTTTTNQKIAVASNFQLVLTGNTNGSAGGSVIFYMAPHGL